MCDSTEAGFTFEPRASVREIRGDTKPVRLLRQGALPASFRFWRRSNAVLDRGVARLRCLVGADHGALAEGGKVVNRLRQVAVNGPLLGLLLDDPRGF